MRSQTLNCQSARAEETKPQTKSPETLLPPWALNLASSQPEDVEVYFFLALLILSIALMNLVLASGISAVEF